MKKYELNLAEYPVIIPVLKKGETGVTEKTETYKPRDTMSNLLRAPGVFKTGEDVVEAILLAKQIRKYEGDVITLDENEVKLMKQCLDVHIAMGAFGGIVHEEFICSIVQIKEVKNG